MALDVDLAVDRSGFERMSWLIDLDKYILRYIEHVRPAGQPTTD